MQDTSWWGNEAPLSCVSRSQYSNGHNSAIFRPFLLIFFSNDRHGRDLANETTRKCIKPLVYQLLAAKAKAQNVHRHTQVGD